VALLLIVPILSPLRLQPDLDKSADGLRAAWFVFLLGRPSIYFSQKSI
jgi:hypothetical protein